MRSTVPFDYSNVAVLEINNFSDYYKQSIVRDKLTSAPFAFEHPEFGDIEFYLQFQPKPTCNRNSSEIYLILIRPPSKFSIIMECHAWMETIDRKCSNTTGVSVLFNESSSYTKWEFLSFEQMSEFFHSTTVFICCYMSYPIKSTGSFLTKNTVHRWRIPDFASRFDSAELKTQWRSNIFEMSEIKGVKFAIFFYPKGHRGNENGCGIFLHAADLADNSTVTVRVDFWIENAESRLWKIGLIHAYSDTMGGGYSVYVEQEKLCDFAQNNPIDICCDVRVIHNSIRLAYISFPHEIASFFNDPYFSDAEIRVENEVFKVSKAIVSSKSPVFRAMFDKETAEQISGVVTIKGFEASMVEKMLIYIYKNEVVNLRKCATQLLPIADCYQVNFLVEMCTDSIIANLTIDNLLTTLELAFQHEHLRQFKNRVLKFAHENCKEMQKLPGYESLLIQVPEIAIELLAMAYA
ncbi:TD and POZ domain-containing protein 1 [Aphelenchoides besseyi]|nr:TD and POZ domain-containing protein 1 [Aphelenchoides besseyi]